MTLSLNTRTVRGVQIIDMAGRLCAGESALLFREAVGLLVGEKGVKLVLNLSKVSYIDSAGLEEIILIYQTLRDSAGTVTLLKPTERVRNLIDITKLSTVLETHDDETKAIHAAGAGAKGSQSRALSWKAGPEAHRIMYKSSSTVFK